MGGGHGALGFEVARRSGGSGLCRGEIDRARCQFVPERRRLARGFGAVLPPHEARRPDRGDQSHEPDDPPGRRQDEGEDSSHVLAPVR